MNNLEIQIATLVGHRDFEMLLATFNVLTKMNAEEVSFCVHDDGTLTEEDISKLKSNFKNSKLILKQYADEVIFERLSKLPYSLKYRKNNVLAKKLFDVPLLSNSEIVRFCDSDVLFLRPVEKLFFLPDENTNCIFMSDWQEAFSVRAHHLLGRKKINLVRKLNSGLFCIKKNVVDLEFVEWFLKKDIPSFKKFSFWLEQTCYAALAARTNTKLWDPIWVRVIRNENDTNEEIAVGHFVSSVRSLLTDSLANLNSIQKAPISIPYQSAFSLTPMQLFADQAKRHLKTNFSQNSK